MLCKKKRIFRLYSTDWAPLDFCIFNPPSGIKFEKPACLDELLSIAEKLSAELKFVRVDLHVSGDDRITFSELTFHPGGGRVRFFPRERDFHFGAKLPR